jgi:uncharacterized membrane protein YGL010W
VSARATRLFSDYASAHSTAGNRACHGVGIPLIVFSIVLALTRVPIEPPWSAAEAAIAAATLAALAIDAAAAMLFFVFLAGSDLVSRAIPSWTSPRFAVSLAAGLFVVGWIFQLVGHAVYEKNRPAFFRNLAHLLIGPLWIARKLL